MTLPSLTPTTTRPALTLPTLTETPALTRTEQIAAQMSTTTQTWLADLDATDEELLAGELAGHWTLAPMDDPREARAGERIVRTPSGSPREVAYRL